MISDQSNLPQLSKTIVVGHGMCYSAQGDSEVCNRVASSTPDNKSERRLPKLGNSESQLTMKKK